jgi:membrane protein DedA with SNARE-associated domain
LWSITFISLGHVLGERWFLVEEYIYRYRFYVFAAVILLMLGAVAYFKFKRTRAKV